MNHRSMPAAYCKERACYALASRAHSATLVNMKGLIAAADGATLETLLQLIRKSLG